MKFKIKDIEILFPFPSIYPEQLAYITELIDLFHNPGHCLIEMPSGTGKTICLLSACISFIQKRKMKIVYCSRTLSETNKTLEELKFFCKTFSEIKILGIGLASRKNLCVNEYAMSSDVDLVCRKLINLESCDFYNNLSDNMIFDGIHNLDEIKNLAQKAGMCPYYMLRRLIPVTDVLVYTYNYLVDPSIHDAVSKEIGKDSIIIFDEAHNIDNYCIEGMSIEIKRSTLDNSMQILKKIQNRDRILTVKKDYGFRDLEKMINPIIYKNENENEPTPNKKIDDSKLNPLLPGSIRKTTHFISVLKRLIEFFKTKLKTSHLTTESPLSFINTISTLTFIDKRTLAACSQRLSLLSREEEDLRPLKKIADFATLSAQFSNTDSFVIIFEPFDSFAPSVFNPILRLYCVDPSVALKNVFEKFRNVIITSGTLSPIGMYPKMLNFTPVKMKEIGVTMIRNSISPLIVTKGNDQLSLSASKTEVESEIGAKSELTTSFNLRSEPGVVRNYGTLLLELSKVVPDGMIAFFPSYSYMEEIISLWSESNFINDISKQKLIFVESPSISESRSALENYKTAIFNGRGSLLMCVSRGKMSEGVDFEGAMGRCVVLIGIPYQFALSERVKQRVMHSNTPGFLAFDAMRHAAQSLGRVMRSKSDYGLMVLADRRFGAMVNKLPRWIQDRMDMGCYNLSVDMSVVIAKKFFREMAQEVDPEYGMLKEDDIGKIK